MSAAETPASGQDTAPSDAGDWAKGPGGGAGGPERHITVTATRTIPARTAGTIRPTGPAGRRPGEPLRQRGRTAAGRRARSGAVGSGLPARGAGPLSREA